jgi:ribose transport system permease protein
MYSGKSPKKVPRNQQFNKLWRRVTTFREGTLIFIIIIIGFVLSLMSSHFLTGDNLKSIAIGLSADGIITVGMTIALVSGGFDFSAGSVISLSGVTAGILFLSGVNIWIACLAAVFAGMLCGLVNGFFIGKVGLNPFITTLAVMGIARGASYVITQGSQISLFSVPESFTFLGQGKIFGFPFIVALFIIIAAFGDFIMRRSEPLRKVLYTGSNEKAAVLSGINTTAVKIGVYVTVATLASIVGILSLARFNMVVYSAGLGTDTSMRSISAAVIGGASLSGGEGTILGSMLGVILLSLINNGLILLNIPVYWQDFINYAILLAAVTIDYVSHKNRLKKLNSR